MCALAQGRVYELVPPGPSGSRVDMVVLAEGYTAAQEAKFVSDAGRVVSGFLETEPYREYADLFNVQAVFIASREAGSDHPLSGVWRDTYFNSSYDTSGFSQVVTVPPNDRDPVAENGLGRIQAVVSSNAPAADLVVLLVNDIVYGGSGGSVLICSLSAASLELLLHESGHTLGLLADEYSDPYPVAPREMPNATARTRRDQIPWRAWIDAATPVPTPDTAEFATRVGLFEGAQYQARGWYRPKLDCRMRTLGQPFCEVCTEQIIRRLYAFGRPAHSPRPAEAVIPAVGGVAVAFEVTVARPRTHAIDLEWFVNGVRVEAATGERWVFDTSVVASGTYEVRCEATDRTPWVRTDPEQRLRATHSWLVQVTRPRLEFGTPVWDASGRLRVRVTGEAPAGFVIESSPDLTWWTPVLTNQLPGQGIEVVLPLDPSTNQRAFRAVAR